MKDKKKKKKDINSYGSAFWLSMTLSSLVVGLLGAVTFAFAVLRIIYGDVWYMWFVLALAGAGALLLASFCTDLLPYWAKTVREMRLLNARMSGAMSVSQINKYEEREDRRNTDIKDSMTESFSRVGQDIVSLRSQVAENDSKMNEIMKTLQEFKKTTSDADYIKQVEDAMKTMSKKIEKYSDYTNSSIKDLQNQIAISKNSETTTQSNSDTSISPSPSIKKIEIIEEVIEKDEKEEEQNKTKIKKPSISSPSKKHEESNKEKKEDLEKEIGPFYVPMSIRDDESTNSDSTDTENTNANESSNSNDSSGDVSNNSSLVFPPVEDNIAATSKDYDEINKELNIALPRLNNNDNQSSASNESESSDDSSSESDSNEDSDSSFDDVQKELNDYFA